MSILAHMEAWEHGQKIDRRSLDYKEVHRKADRHYIEAEGKFVADSSYDRLMCENESYGDGFIVYLQDGSERVYPSDEDVWWGVVGSELQVVVNKPKPQSKVDLVDQLVNGPSRCYTAPVKWADDVEPPMPLEGTRYPVCQKVCSNCGNPAEGTSLRVFCSEACEDEYYSPHDVEPLPPPPFITRWGWRHTGIDWELIPVAG